MFYNSLNYDVTSFDNTICSKKLVINRGCGHVFQYVNTKTMKKGVGYEEYNEAFDQFVENLLFWLTKMISENRTFPDFIFLIRISNNYH